MSYNVLIVSDIYRGHPLYKEWMNYLHGQGRGHQYDVYLKAFYPEVFDYVEYIYNDKMYFDIDENLYNTIEFIDENTYKRKRYRLFAFHSEAHYTWFKLRW